MPSSSNIRSARVAGETAAAPPATLHSRKAHLCVLLLGGTLAHLQTRDGFSIGVMAIHIIPYNKTALKDSRDCWFACENPNKISRSFLDSLFSFIINTFLTTYLDDNT
jgi:hypothetical protein